VVAIIITIIVLELKVPQVSELSAPQTSVPVFLVLSCVNIGIFRNNYHHMLQRTERIDGRVLWANLLILFWLSLLPLVIRWMDQSRITPCRRRLTALCRQWTGSATRCLRRRSSPATGGIPVTIGADVKSKLSPHVLHRSNTARLRQRVDSLCNLHCHRADPVRARSAD
jgi:hypothetical protein